MPGLQDLLLLRQLQDQADPVRSAFQSLADGVGLGIEEARAAQKQKKELEQQNALLMSRINSEGDATNSSKTTRIVHKTDLATGQMSAPLQSLSPAEMKAQKEMDMIGGFEDAVRSGMSVEDLS